ncbi:hypothetical protein HY78_14470 [Rhizorhabdus wittichii DC-6]|nr:hypothetical protein HY78_14470 [Rhizorhabdus wittichii DC-6]
MIATLIKIDAWDPVADAAATLRAASHDHPEVCHLGGATWWPAITQLPKLRYDLFSGAFDGVLDTPSSSLTLALEAFPTLPRLALADARLQLWTGEVGAAWESYVLRFDGIVTEQARIDDDMLAQLTISVDDRWLDTPLLALYEGTTGLEGEDGQKGLPKPLAIGMPRYAPGELIDSIDTVVQLSGYGAIGGVLVAMEKLSRFTASVGDYASLAALKAAAIPAGAWATCNAHGLVRHGAPLEGQPSYILEGDIAGVDGWARKPGEIIRRLAGLVEDAGAVSDSSLDALDAARPFNLSLYQAEQLTARELIQRIAASVNAVAGVSWLGELFAVPIAIGEPSLTLRSDGQAMPIIGNVTQVPASAPFWRIALLAQRTWHKHGFADIAFSGRLTPRGRFMIGEPYREGDMVDMPDGSQWLFIGTAPATGVVPGTAPAIWFNLSAALDPADIRYDGGAGPTLQDLKPAEPGATAGAPPGTKIGDIPVEVFISDLANVVADMSITAPALFQLTKAVGLLNDYMQAKTTLQGKAIGTVVVQVQEVGESNVATLNLIGAKNGAGTAFVLDTSTVMVSPTESIGAKLSSIDANIGTAAASVSFLMEAVVDTSGATIAKAVLSLKAGPAGSMRVSGIVATNDGAISTLDLDFDRTRIFRPDGELLFLADEDGVYMPNVEIDRVKINSVAVPVYASSSASITGTGTSATAFEGYTSTLTESITLPVAGTINIDAVVGMSFAGSPSVWQLQLLCDGDEVDVAGGVNSQEKVPLMAQIEKPAGTYSLQLKFGGHNLSTMYNRKLRATGHPYTG